MFADSLAFVSCSSLILAKFNSLKDNCSLIQTYVNISAVSQVFSFFIYYVTLGRKMNVRNCNNRWRIFLMFIVFQYCHRVCTVATSPLALRSLCDSPRTGCARRITIYIYVARTSNNRVIMVCELYCCLLPQCEALRTCRSGFRSQQY